MTTPNHQIRCYSAALKMLMRREHSKLELFNKLQLKGYDDEIIDSAITQLVEQNYQSDERFAEAFILMRFNQGKGPVRIASELKLRGISSFNLSDFDWFKSAKEIRKKKFGDIVSLDFKEQAKQKRFLQSRGFNLDQINQSF
ncbi:regulatory protein RecX [Candidatus Pseudothioglobus singularis]|uniref:Regulatory protein RecX n=1 Tax=Candidatus Pseudothioglobus singularis PS1 TaxID=1125411 RepID=A0A0M5KRL3_9GAMM|nr:regulatory protein RecX [Candidatus Pseudothioglobus singularis]ALE01536.1 RecX family transcriptional regulator [Candidatus Pseudothioglobus singularis PS1]